ncbi:MAG: single-stranded DNA-binding protein [Gorillibacterium sp.]|nr:single-stranded DNA-binding protein [Gorillibacterium sp.]
MLNRVILIGRLTRDPELRYTPAGVAVTQFTLAVDRNFATQQKEKEADFIPVVTWRQLAETCANYLRKGRLAAVEGRLQIRNYDNNEGRKVYVTEVIADNVRFLESSGSSNREGGSPGGNSRDEVPGNRQQQSGSGSGRRDHQDPFADDGKPIDISDDDLPF